MQPFRWSHEKWSVSVHVLIIRYPGDGVAPLASMLRDLRRIGFRGVLSLELFNRDYWKQDALKVAQTGLDKMRAVVRASV
jgi:2-keto-myo-inositol isomerase